MRLEGMLVRLKAEGVAGGEGGGAGGEAEEAGEEAGGEAGCDAGEAEEGDVRLGRQVRLEGRQARLEVRLEVKVEVKLVRLQAAGWLEVKVVRQEVRLVRLKR